eukprot:COSAG06_NODE_458_length_15468_cov_5.851074_8_plen_87_part_00
MRTTKFGVSHGAHVMHGVGISCSRHSHGSCMDTFVRVDVAEAVSYIAITPGNAGRESNGRLYAGMMRTALKLASQGSLRFVFFCMI